MHSKWSLWFYKDKLRANGIEPIIPEKPEDRDYMKYSLRNELGRGVINRETKRVYLAIIRQLIEQCAQGIVPGRTGIPLLIKQENVFFRSGL